MGIPKHYYLMVDTETCGDLEKPYVYDLGMAIVDRKGKVYAKYSFVIADIFYGMADLMQTAYYAEKIPMYKEDIKNGTRKVIDFFTANRVARELIKRWNVTAIVAHNARFDNNALNNTATFLNGKNLISSLMACRFGVLWQWQDRFTQSVRRMLITVKKMDIFVKMVHHA